MNNDAELIHSHHFDPFKNWHVFALIVPSVIFVFVMAVFFKKPEVKGSATASFVAELSPTPIATPTLAPTNKYSDISINNLVNVKAEVVDTELDRAIGLSKYDSLPKDAGMLFVFEPDSSPKFWMKDMKFAIDMIWISKGKVIQIDNDAEPEPGVPDSKLKIYPPSDPIDYVLEVNAGFSKENNIKLGSSVEITSK